MKPYDHLQREANRHDITLDGPDGKLTYSYADLLNAAEEARERQAAKPWHQRLRDRLAMWLRWLWELTAPRTYCYVTRCPQCNRLWWAKVVGYDELEGFEVMATEDVRFGLWCDCEV